MAANSKPISPMGTNPLRKIGMAYREVLSPRNAAGSPSNAVGASQARAAMPQIPGRRKRQTKKKLVRV